MCWLFRSFLYETKKIKHEFLNVFRKKESLVAPAVALLNTNVGEFDVAKVGVFKVGLSYCDCT